MKIGIIGRGMVGDAVLNGFSKCSSVISDPAYNTTTVRDVCLKADVIFVCVPTPTINNKFDPSIINNTMMIINNNFTGDVVIKSTILPDTLNDLYNNNKNINIVYSPEFLSDKTANEDFIKPHMVVIGSNSIEAANRIKDLFQNESDIKCNNYHIVDLITASLLKYGFNTFYATKVIFMNEMFNVLNASGAETSWNEFKQIYGSHPWIGSMHLDVPGHDGYFGYGGKCFPKDTVAFSNYASNLNKPMQLLNEVIELNNVYRNE